MEEIKIIVQRKAALLAPVLKKEADALQKKWPDVRFSEEDEGAYHLFILSLPQAEFPVLKGIFTTLSIALTDHILSHRQDDIIVRLVEEQFYFLTREIKNQLYDTFAEKEEEIELKCRRLIYLSLLQHLLSEGDLNLEGFIDFRLREYWEELSMALLDRINALLFAEDQAEILQLLRRILVLEKMRLIKGGIE